MYDLIVIGAGPAGAQTAHLLAQEGRQVLLLERAAKGRTKCCAGAISGRALALLDGIELPNHVPLQAVDVFCHGKKARFQSSEPVANFVRRCEFDQLLQERAQDAGADLRYRTPAQAIKLLKQGVEVTTEKGEQFQGKYLVGADGATGISKRLMNPEATRMAIGLEGELPATKYELPSGTALVDYGCTTKGYGWVFPRPGGYSVGICSFSQKPVPLKEDFQHFLTNHKIPPPHNLMAHPLPCSASLKLAGERVLLVGDAAGLVDPLLGEGIAYALTSGQLAATTIGSALENGQSLSVYSELVEEQIRSQFEVLSRLQRLIFAWPSLTQRLVRRHEGLLTEYFAAIGGQQSYTELGAKLKPNLFRGRSR